MRSIVVVVGLVLAALLGSEGCAYRARTSERRVQAVTPQRLANLERRAARDMGCPGAATMEHEIGPGIFRLSGCGQVREYSMHCGTRRRGRCTWQPIVPVVVPAARDLSCPVEQQQVTQGPRATELVVEGCGHRASYVLACGVIDCAWALSSDQVVAQPPAIPAAIVIIPEQSAEAPPPTTTTTDAGAAIEQQLRAAIDARSAALRACAGGPLAVRAAWSADGSVRIGVGSPYAGTPVEGCVVAAMGTLRVEGASAAGEILHAVQ